MRWPAPKIGDTRTLRRFAFLPVLCDDGTNVWLETVYIDQVFGPLWEHEDYDPDPDECRWITKAIRVAQ